MADQIAEGDMVKVPGGHYGTVIVILGKFAKVKTGDGTLAFLLTDLTIAARKKKETK